MAEMSPKKVDNLVVRGLFRRDFVDISDEKGQIKNLLSSAFSYCF
jgi:hypothetical protein